MCLRGFTAWAYKCGYRRLYHVKVSTIKDYMWDINDTTKTHQKHLGFHTMRRTRQQRQTSSSTSRPNSTKNRNAELAYQTRSLMNCLSSHMKDPVTAPDI